MSQQYAAERSSGDLSAVPGASPLESLFRRTEPQNASHELVPEYVWGVDASTRRVAIAAADRDAQIAEVVTVEWDPALRTGARLDAIYSGVWLAAAPFCHSRPPIIAFVEQPAAFGHHVEPELMYVVGTVQAALYGALMRKFAHPVEVQTVPIARWKSQATGHSYAPGLPKTASKTAKRKAEKARIVLWAQRNGYQGEDEDEADAGGIAVAGVKLIAPQPEQLALST